MSKSVTIYDDFYSKADIDFISELITDYFDEKGIEAGSFSWILEVHYEPVDEE